jgi:hypothetical protein
MIIYLDGLEHSSVERLSCDDAETTFQLQSVCSSLKILTMNKKNAHPLLETGASENVEDVGEKCRH